MDHLQSINGGVWLHELLGKKDFFEEFSYFDWSKELN